MLIDSTIAFNLIIVVILLFANAFFVASEFALVSVRQTRMLQLSKEGNSTATIAIHALEHLDRYIAAVQLGITISSLGIGWCGEGALAKLIAPLFSFLPVGKDIAVHSVSVTIAFSLITLLHVVIGELMPKSIALQYPEKTTLFVTRPMAVITKLFTPFIFILNGFGNLLLRMLRIPPATSTHVSHSAEELNLIIDASCNEGMLNETEKDMLQNVLKFSDLVAKQIMVPRPDMIAIESIMTLDEIEQIVSEYQYTRYPVYEEDLDHVIGILHVKDLYALRRANKEFNIHDLLREPLLVPETVKMDQLVRDFKTTKNQLAIVIDEFGGTSGLITLEDVLEEIFGEVQDEFDEEEADIKQISEDEYIVNAMLRIDELEEMFELGNLEEEDVDTVAGIVVKELGRIAEVNDVVIYEGLEFTVIEIDGARIMKLKIKKLPQVAKESEENN
ncbi:HlyC/CorC family transporter [bacterium]|nr:HlyC/CorC family transporter [bacterium]